MTHLPPFDDACHAFSRCIECGSARWRDIRPGIQYYYAEDELYVLRDNRFRRPFFAFVHARSPEEAAAIMDYAEPEWKRRLRLRNARRAAAGRRPMSERAYRRSMDRYQDWLRADSGLSFREYFTRGAR